MLGSLFLALGIVSCSAAGGNCDSPSTQLVRAEPQTQSRPNVTIEDQNDIAKDDQGRVSDEPRTGQH